MCYSRHMSIWLFMTIIALHFFGSLFMHSFYLHRYGTHGQFIMSRFWERTFYFLTWFLQGSSFLNPKAYAKMHLQHHEHSDKKDDPHSPLNFSKKKYGIDVLFALPRMMIITKNIYIEVRDGVHSIANLYQQRKFPQWEHFQKFAGSNIVMIVMALLAITFYALFAPTWWCWLFLPLTLMNGPIQGAIVNWCGHMWGYRNFKLGDNSKNTWILSTIMLGELYQNNHHQHPDSPNFAQRWFEFDPIYPVTIVMHKLRIIRFKAK